MVEERFWECLEREAAEATEVVGGENHSLSHSDGADRWPCRGGGD